MTREIVDSIITDTPKAFAKLVSYMLDKTADGKPEALKNVMPMDATQRMLMYNTPGRHLYGFFDDHKIFPFPIPNTSDLWEYRVVNADGEHLSGGAGCAYRERAEELAFQNAFFLMEKDL